jgi:hypothetical protein
MIVCVHTSVYNKLEFAYSVRTLARLSLPENISSVDIALSSYPGIDVPTDLEWNDEFQRAMQMISSPTGGATLFAAEFAAVPSTTRLAEWIATKWAPVILRSYEMRDGDGI